jgi:hypothetical protein
MLKMRESQTKTDLCLVMQPLFTCTGSIPPEALTHVDEARGMVELATREAAAAAAAVAAVSQVSFELWVGGEAFSQQWEGACAHTYTGASFVHAAVYTRFPDQTS